MADIWMQNPEILQDWGDFTGGGGAGVGAGAGAVTAPALPQTISQGGYDYYLDPFTNEWALIGSTPTSGGGGADSALGWAGLGQNQAEFEWQKQMDLWSQGFQEQQWGSLSGWQQAQVDAATREFENLSAWQQAQVAGGQTSQAWEEYKYANPSAFDKLTLELQQLSLQSENHWKEISANIAKGQLDLAWKGLELDDKNTNRSMDIQLELGQGQLDLGRYVADLNYKADMARTAAQAAAAQAAAQAQIAAAQIQAGATRYAADKSYQAAHEATLLAAELGRRELALREEIDRGNLKLEQEKYMLALRRSPADYMAYWGSTQPGATQGAPAVAGQGQAMPQTAAGAGAMWGMSPPTEYGGQGTATAAPAWLTQTLAGQPMGEQQMPAWGFERGPEPY